MDNHYRLFSDVCVPVFERVYQSYVIASAHAGISICTMNLYMNICSFVTFSITSVYCQFNMYRPCKSKSFALQKLHD